VGIDRGVTVALALSDGTTREHGPWLTDGESGHLRRLQTKSARQRANRPKKTRPSARERRTHDRIARLRAKAKRRAVDWQHRTTTELADTLGVIVVEDLKITHMMRSAKGTLTEPGRNVAQKAGLNRVISGESWGRTVTLLEYKSADRGGKVVKVPAPGTSQTCHRCEHRDPASRDGTVFACADPGLRVGRARRHQRRRQHRQRRRACGVRTWRPRGCPVCEASTPARRLTGGATGESPAFRPRRRSTCVR
jgi:putative transposase